MNFFNKKTQKKLVVAVAILCIILMVVSMLSALAM